MFICGCQNKILLKQKLFRYQKINNIVKHEKYLDKMRTILNNILNINNRFYIF